MRVVSLLNSGAHINTVDWVCYAVIVTSVCIVYMIDDGHVVTLHTRVASDYIHVGHNNAAQVVYVIGSYDCYSITTSTPII